MKSTGITRKIDELGRIVIPKEIRKNLGIRDGESLEIYTNEDSIILRKHSQMEKFQNLGVKLAEIIATIFKVEVIITDREKVIVATNDKELVNKKIGNELINLIDNREELNDTKKTLIQNIEVSGILSIVPIIAASDSLGLVIVVSNTEKDYSNISRLIAKILSEKIDIY